MFKYILKRLAIAVLVLFGVSVIIYSLVRLMPTDFVDQKYQPLVQNGQMAPERLTELKELYAGNGMVGFVAKERVDGKLVLPEAVKLLKMASA